MSSMTSSPLLEIVYASRAVKSFGDADLRSLLAKARMKNKVGQVTGLLVYYERSFLQLLEGPDEGVRAVYERVQQDPRHLDIQMLGSSPLVKRAFADWSMGFADPSAAARVLEGYVRLKKPVQFDYLTYGQAKSILTKLQGTNQPI